MHPDVRRQAEEENHPGHPRRSVDPMAELDMLDAAIRAHRDDMCFACTARDPGTHPAEEPTTGLGGAGMAFDPVGTAPGMPGPNAPEQDVIGTRDANGADPLEDNLLASAVIDEVGLVASEPDLPKL